MDVARPLLRSAAMRLAFAAAVALVAVTAACTLHWGGDDDIYCPAGGGGAEPALLEELLDPWTLECTSFGGGCGPCGACGAEADQAADPIALPSWGSCSSACIGLDEDTCIETPACRTAYDHACLYTDGPCPLFTPFLGCFPVDQTGPVQGECGGLDAQTCSRHDDCLATYSPGAACQNGLDDDGDGQIDDSDECTLQFQLCAPELRTTCPGTDCG